MKLDLVRKLSAWEAKRADRLFLESKYATYTGNLDFCELHIPYTHWSDVNIMLNKAEKINGHKTLFLLGDSLNLDLFSRFYQKSMDKSKPSEEMEILISFLKSAEHVYDKILFMISNHEKRRSKVIMQYIVHKEIAQEVLDMIESYYEVFMRNKLNKIEVIDHWIFQVGNILGCHIENNSNVAGAVARELIQYLIPRVEKHWDIAMQAHTHSQLKVSLDGKHCIETGAILDSLDYWISGKISGKGKHSTIGYAICRDMKKGIADINNCDYKVSKWQGFI